MDRDTTYTIFVSSCFSFNLVVDLMWDVLLKECMSLDSANEMCREWNFLGSCPAGNSGEEFKEIIFHSFWMILDFSTECRDIHHPNTHFQDICRKQPRLHLYHFINSIPNSSQKSMPTKSV